MYEMVPSYGVYPVCNQKNNVALVIALIIIAALVLMAVIYFSKRGYYYSLERDDKGRITGIMEKPIKG